MQTYLSYLHMFKALLETSFTLFQILPLFETCCCFFLTHEFSSILFLEFRTRLFKVFSVAQFFLSLTLSVPQDFHGCTQPFFIYTQNIMVYNLTAYNYVSLKDNPNKVYIKLKGIGCTI